MATELDVTTKAETGAQDSLLGVDAGVRQRDLAFELKCSMDQFLRYGTEPECPELVDAVALLTDINDDIAHGRSAECISESVSEIYTLLARLPKEYGTV